MLPWYKALRDALQPIEGHETAALLAIAGVTIIIAWKGDSVTKLGWFIYLVSP